MRKHQPNIVLLFFMHVFILTDCVNGDERFCSFKMAKKRGWSQHKAFITVWVNIDFVTGNILFFVLFVVLVYCS